MKMRTKKCGIYAALAAVLLVSAVLVTNCVDPLGPGDFLAPPGKEQVRFVPPPGMGYISLNAIVEGEGSGARTAFPTSSFTLANLPRVDVILTAQVTPGNSQTISTWGKSSTGISVVPDTYKVQLIGYSSTAATLAVAFGEAAADVVVNSGQGESTNVVMKEITDGTGTGSLSWAFTNTVGVTSAVMKVVGLLSTTDDTHDGGIVYTDVVGGDLMTATTPALSGSLTLKSGYYRIELTLVKANYQTATIREIAHIWNGHTTTSKITSLTLNSNVHTVTYHYNDTRAGTPATTTKDFAHAGEFTHPGAGEGTEPQFATNAAGTAFDATRAFEGWWTGDGTPAGNPPLPVWGTQWIAKDSGAGTPVSGTPVLRPQALYAKWAAGTSIAITATLEFDGDNEVTFVVRNGLTVVDPGEFEVSQVTPPTLTITATPTEAIAGATYVWTYAQGVSGALPTGVSATTNVLTVDFSANNLLTIPGPHRFEVEINDLWSGFVEITVP
jgi:hypothetical protein